MFSNTFFVFILTGGCGFLFILGIHHLALKFGVTPKQSFRRPDQKPVALLGGLGIFLACVVGNTYLQNPTAWMILAAGIPLVITGVLDDVWEIRARIKLVGQISAVLIWIGLVTPKELFYSQMGLPPLMGAAVTALFLMTLANAYNFLDGVDGQVGGMALVAFAALSLSLPNHEAVGLMFVAAIGGFLMMNFPPAQIYLGEVGASFLGFAAGCLASLIPAGESPWIRFWAINFIFFLAFCDVIAAVFRRIRSGIGPWHPDREHFHHKLLRIGFGSRVVLAISLTIMVFSSLTGGALLSIDDTKTAALMGFATGGLLLFIYSGILVLDHHMANRVSVFGRTLIEKYFSFDSSKQSLPEDSWAVVFDFLPYYNDLQREGLGQVDAFVKRMSETVSGIGDRQSLRLVGCYTVVIVFNSQQRAGLSEQGIADRFREVLLDFKVLKNTAKVPEGLYFHASLDAEIERLLDGQIHIVRLRQVA